MPICTARIGARHQAGEAASGAAHAEHHRDRSSDVDADRATIPRFGDPARTSMPTRVRMTRR